MADRVRQFTQPGTAHAFRRAADAKGCDRLPYNVAIVALDEGPRLMTNLVRLDQARIVADAGVRLVVEPRDGLAVLGPQAAQSSADRHRLPVSAAVAPLARMKTPEEIKIIELYADVLEKGIPAVIEKWRDTFGV